MLAPLVEMARPLSLVSRKMRTKNTSEVSKRYSTSTSSPGSSSAVVEARSLRKITVLEVTSRNRSPNRVLTFSNELCGSKPVIVPEATVKCGSAVHAGSTSAASSNKTPQPPLIRRINRSPSPIDGCYVDGPPARVFLVLRRAARAPLRLKSPLVSWFRYKPTP